MFYDNLFVPKSIKLFVLHDCVKIRPKLSYLFVNLLNVTMYFYICLQISGVQCPFDRVLEPQRAIDWYQERVGHLEESLEQAIHLNLKDFIPPNGPRSKPVTMSTAQFFGEGEQLIQATVEVACKQVNEKFALHR